VNALRAHLAEFGIVAAQGLRNVAQLIAIVRDEDDLRLPDVAREGVQGVGKQNEEIETGDKTPGEKRMGRDKNKSRSPRPGEHSGHWADHRHGDCHDGCGPECVPLGPRVRGLAGPGAAAEFDRRENPAGRDHEARQRYLRRLLINGASANLLRSKATKADPWVIGIRRRRPPLVVAVALANKTARIAWA